MPRPKYHEHVEYKVKTNYKKLTEEERLRCWRNLMVCGGNVWVASEGMIEPGEGGFPEFTFDVYIAAVNDPEFEKFAEKFTATFHKFFEGTLIGDLAYLRKVWRGMKPSEKNYPRILGAYIRLQDRTQPIVDRMKRVFGRQEFDMNDFTIELVPNEARKSGEQNDSEVTDGSPDSQA